MVDLVNLGFRVDSDELEKADRRMDALDRSGKRVEDRSGSLSNGFRNLALTVGTLGFAALARDALGTFASFESMSASLKTVTGSAVDASIEFAKITEFAKTTPYELDQAVQGFVKLKSLGLDPSMEALNSYGNTASAMGKSLNDMIEAVADASTMEFERLKEFGIKAKQQGDEVSFTFQGVTTTVQKEAAAIEAYLMGIGDTQFATAMSDQMDTVNGALSNMGDAFGAFQRTVISQTGAGDAYKNMILGIGSAIESATSFVESAVREWQVFNFALAYDAGPFYTTLRNIGEVMGTIRGQLAPVIPYLDDFAIAMTAVAGLSVGVYALGAAFALISSPVTLTIAAIAGGAILIRENWNGITAWWSGLWEGLDGDVSQFAGRLVASIGGMISNFRQAATEVATDFGERLSTLIGSAITSIDWPSAADIARSAAQMIVSFANIAVSAGNALMRGLSSRLGTLGSDVQWPTAQQIIASAGALIRAFADTATSMAQAFSAELGPGLRRAFSSIDWPTASAVLSSAAELVAGFGSLALTAVRVLATNIGSALSSVWSSIDWPTPAELGRGAAQLVLAFGSIAVDAVGALVSKLSSGLRGASGEISWPTVTEILSGAGSMLFGFVRAAASFITAFYDELGAGIRSGFSGIEWPTARQVLSSAGSLLLAFNDLGWQLIRAMGAGLSNLGTAVIDGIKDGLSGGSVAIANALADMVEDIRWIGPQLAEKIRPDMEDAGEFAALGTAVGIRNGIAEVERAAQALAIMVPQTIEQELQIQSPSRVLMRVGRDVGMGFAVGLMETESAVDRAAAGLAESGVGAFTRINRTLIMQRAELTMTADAYRLLELELQGVTAAAAQDILSREKSIETLKDQARAAEEFGREMNRGILQSISSADSVKDAMRNLGDFMKDWLRQQINEFAANKIQVLFGLGGEDGSGGLQGILDQVRGIFSGGSAGEGNIFGGVVDKIKDLGGKFGGMLDGIGVDLGSMAGRVGQIFNGSAGPVGLMATASYKIGEMFGDLVGAADSAKAGVGALLGPIPAVIGAALGSSWQKIEEGFDIAFSQGNLTGLSFDYMTKERSAWRGTAESYIFSELNSEVEEALTNYFSGLNNTIVDQAENLGVDGADMILSSFEVASQRFRGANIEEQLADYMEETTKSAYALAFRNMAPELQLLINNTGLEIFEASSEEIGAVMQELGTAFSVLAPQMRTAGLDISESLTPATTQALAFAEAAGGMGPALELTARYIDAVVPASEIAAESLRSTTLEISEWNLSIGRTGAMVIDTLPELQRYVDGIDQTSVAGAAAAVSAMQQVDSIIALEAAQQQAKTTLDAVKDAQIAMNLNFDPTIAGASGMAAGLVELMGGLEQFTQVTGSYYESFYSETEQAALASAQAASEVLAFNQSLSEAALQAAGVTDGIIDTKEEFRAYVESLNLTTEAGQQAFAAAMELQGSMLAVADAEGSLNDMINALPPELQGAFNQMLTDAQQAAAVLPVDIANSLQSIIDMSSTAGAEMQNNLLTMFNAVMANAGVTAEQLPPALRAGFDQMVSDASAAAGGLATQASNMAGSIWGLRDPLGSAGAAASSASGNLSKLPGVLNSVGNAAQEMARKSQAAANAASGSYSYWIDRARKEAAARVDGSHSLGLDYVPRDGYIAELHKGEMVMPRNVSDWLRGAGVSAPERLAPVPRPSLPNDDREKTLGALERVVQKLTDIQSDNSDAARESEGMSENLAARVQQQTEVIRDLEREQSRLRRELALTR